MSGKVNSLHYRLVGVASRCACPIIATKQRHMHGGCQRSKAVAGA